jgi:hypothetical protein
MSACGQLGKTEEQKASMLLFILSYSTVNQFAWGGGGAGPATDTLVTDSRLKGEEKIRTWCNVFTYPTFIS